MASRILPMLSKNQAELSKSFEYSQSLLSLNWVPLLEQHQTIHRICMQEMSNYMKQLNQNTLEVSVNMIFQQSQRHVFIVLKAFLNLFHKMSEKLKIMSRKLTDGSMITPEFIIKFVGEHCSGGDGQMMIDDQLMTDILKETSNDNDLPGVDPNDPKSYVIRHNAIIERMNDSAEISLRLLNEFLLSKRKITMKGSGAFEKLRVLKNNLESLQFQDKDYTKNLAEAVILTDPQNEIEQYKTVQQSQDELMQKTMHAYSNVKKHRMQDAYTAPDTRIFDINELIQYKRDYQDLDEAHRLLLQENAKLKAELVEALKKHGASAGLHENTIKILETQIEEKQGEIINFRGELSHAGGEVVKNVKEITKLKEEVATVGELKKEVKDLRIEKDILIDTKQNQEREIVVKTKKIEEQVKIVKVLTEEIKELKSELHKIKLMTGKGNAASFNAAEQKILQNSAKIGVVKSATKGPQVVGVLKTGSLASTTSLATEEKQQKHHQQQQEQQQEQVEQQDQQSQQDQLTSRRSSSEHQGLETFRQEPSTQIEESIIDSGKIVESPLQNANARINKSTSSSASPVKKKVSNSGYKQQTANSALGTDSYRSQSVGRNNMIRRNSILPPLNRENTLEKKPEIHVKYIPPRTDIPEKPKHGEKLNEHFHDKRNHNEERMNSIEEIQDDLSQTLQDIDPRQTSDLTLIRETIIQTTAPDEAANLNFQVNDRPISAIKNNQNKPEEGDQRRFDNQRYRLIDSFNQVDKATDTEFLFEHMDGANDNVSLLLQADKANQSEKNGVMLRSLQDTLPLNYYQNSQDRSQLSQDKSHISTFQILNYSPKAEKNDSLAKKEGNEQTFDESADQAIHYLKRYLFIRKVIAPRDEKLIWIIEFLVAHFDVEKARELKEFLKVSKALDMPVSTQEIYSKILSLPKGSQHYVVNPKNASMIITAIMKEEGERKSEQEEANLKRRNNHKMPVKSLLSEHAATEGDDTVHELQRPVQEESSNLLHGSFKYKRNESETLLAGSAKPNLLARYGFRDDSYREKIVTEKVHRSQEFGYESEKNRKNDDYLNHLYDHLTRNAQLREQFMEVIRNSLRNSIEHGRDNGRELDRDNAKEHGRDHAGLFSEQNLKRAFENSQEFKSFFKRVLHDHSRCGSSCPHLKRFYEKVGFDILRAKKGLYSVPVAIIKEPIFNEKDILTKVMMKKKLGEPY